MEKIIRKAMDKNKEVPHHSVKTIIEDLEGITEIAFADSFVTIKPISKTQKKCLKLFNTSEPVSPLDIGHSSYTIFLTHRKFNKFSLVSEISDKSSDKFRNKT